MVIDGYSFNDDDSADKAPLKITGCTFYNISSERGIIHFYYSEGTHVLRDCIFDGLQFEDGLNAIECIGNYENHNTVNIENCEFLHCSSVQVDDISGLVRCKWTEFYGFLGKQERDYTTAVIKNCKGLDNAKMDGVKAKEIKIRDKAIDGAPLGAITDEGNVGIPGFDYAAVPASKPVLA
ncbi:hypothetical protein AGMMS49546_35930 [Spirochaetia bacterium]|nr:hypothetical protein AGMMS49546_35930 [Spirochaetia bacterium]